MHMIYIVQTSMRRTIVSVRWGRLSLSASLYTPLMMSKFSRKFVYTDGCGFSTPQPEVCNA